MQDLTQWGFSQNEREVKKNTWTHLSFFSGLLLIGDICVLTIPTIAQMADTSLGDHLRHLLVIFFLGALGLHLRRTKTGDGSVFILRLIVIALLLTPVLDLQVASKVIQEYGLLASLPGARAILALVCVVLFVVPYVFGRNIFVHQSNRRSSRPSVTPQFTLYMFGLACAFLPCTAAAFFALVGLPQGDLNYVCGLSYVVAAIWSVWWYYRYSKPLSPDKGY